MEECVFPHTAVIETLDIDEACQLLDFLGRHGFRWGDDGVVVGADSLVLNGYVTNSCFDIEYPRKAVSCANREYYENDFEYDYPDLMPEDEKWFLCSVHEFITMCGGDVHSTSEFEIADEVELNSFLFSK